MDKKQLDLLLRNPEASSAENLRIRVSSLLLLLILLSCTAFLISYIVTGQYQLIPYLLVPFFIPMLLAWYYLNKTRSYLLVLWTFIYLYTIMGLMNLLSSPDYLVDFFIIPVLMGAAFLVLSYKHALMLVCYVLLLYALTAAVVYFYQPFEIIYTNENTSSVIVGFLVSILLAGVLYYFFARSYQKNSDILSSAIVALNKINDDNKLLLSVISHDFRNYLVRVLLQVEEGKSVCEGKRQLQGLEQIEDSIHELSGLLNEVEQVRSLFQDEASEELAEVPFSEIMKKVELIFRQQIYQKAIMFEIREGGDLALKVNVDVFIHIILANIIGNAIRFSPKNSRILFSLVAGPEGKTLTISNLTMANQLDKLKRIERGGNKPFAEEDSDNEQGVGLGVGIVRRFCRAYDIRYQLSFNPIQIGDFCRVNASLVFK